MALIKKNAKKSTLAARFLAYNQRMKVHAIALVALLLLPSSLWAAVTTAQNCAERAAQQHMECCCDHDSSPEEHRGPQLVSDCCCEVKAPVLPSQLPDAPRLQQERETSLALLLIVEARVGPPVAPINAFAQVMPPGPPRAPPRALFLSFQRFLI